MTRRHASSRANAPVVTALFQFGKALAAGPGGGDTSGPIPAHAPVTLTDPAGNQFRLLAGKEWQRHTGQQSGPAANGKLTRGYYDSVWINHGAAPQNQGYAYVILPKVGARVAQLPPWRLAEQSDAAHVVVFPQERSTLHVLFEATEKPVGDVLRCDRPCLAWVTGAGSEHVTVRVCDPDLNCPGGAAGESAALSQPTEVTLEVAGCYRIAGAATAAVAPGRRPGSTRLIVRCTAGAPVTVVLAKAP